MATKKITELSELQLADVAADLSKTVLLAVDESGGTPVTKKVTLATIDSAVERSINTSTAFANAAYAQANTATISAAAAYLRANSAINAPIMLTPKDNLTLTYDYNIPTGYTGISRGTITINAGIIVTIQPDAEWVISN